MSAFVLQEHLERMAYPGGFPSGLHERPFVVGTLLQLPFGAAVWLLARSLLRAAGELGFVLRRLDRRSKSSLAEAGLLPVSVVPPRSSMLASGPGQRAPPPFA